ncbi:hypothetical protein BJY01DRAFT_256612 [Aspergillus pseudoustus]|uniref:Uncharacterized protein n=1 Tax=Aspergillus pseudoustus TaxID=1810923 RepID=A0ABR4I6Q5_9EURO
MYMNCAQVTVHADATAAHDDGRTVPDQPAPMRWADRPTIFVANVNAEGQCTTVENVEVNFPRPGPEAEGALSGPGFRCAGAATFLDGGNDPAPAVASGSTPTPSIGVVPSLAGASCSLTPSGTAAVTGNVMDPAFGVNIINNLDRNIHAWSVAREPGPERLIAARGGSYFEAWRTRDDNGGISIKLALEASQKSILQFEYSLVAALVYWDVSFIDLDRASDFITHGINMSTSDPQCPGLICRPGDQNCSSVYLEPDDNYAVRGCLRETNLTLSIGSWPE